MLGQERKANVIEGPPLDLSWWITEFREKTVTPHQPIAYYALHLHGCGVYGDFAARRPELMWHLCPDEGKWIQSWIYKTCRTFQLRDCGSSLPFLFWPCLGYVWYVVLHIYYCLHRILILPADYVWLAAWVQILGRICLYPWGGLWILVASDPPDGHHTSDGYPPELHGLGCSKL